MNLKLLRDDVVAGLAAALDPLKFEPHGGRFDIQELDSYASSAPEVRVCTLAARRTEKGRGANVLVDFAGYVIAGRDRVLLASERGLIIASQLMQYLAVSAPGGPSRGAGQPEKIAWQNLYSAESRERNKHLSAVTWSQTFEIEQEGEPDLADFLKAVVSYDTAPTDDQLEATDTVTLPGPPP